MKQFMKKAGDPVFLLDRVPPRTAARKEDWDKIIAARNLNWRDMHDFNLVEHLDVTEVRLVTDGLFFEKVVEGDGIV